MPVRVFRVCLNRCRIVSVRAGWRGAEGSAGCGMLRQPQFDGEAFVAGGRYRPDRPPVYCRDPRDDGQTKPGTARVACLAGP